MGRAMKYELTRKKLDYYGKELYRIRATEEILNDKGGIVAQKGDLGGFVQSEENLGQSGYDWIADNAKVYDNAYISGGSIVRDNAEVFGNAVVLDKSDISGDCAVSGDCVIDSSQISEHARVFGRAYVDKSILGGMISVFGNSIITSTDLHEYKLAVDVCGCAHIVSRRDIIEMAGVSDGVGDGGLPIVAYRVYSKDKVNIGYSNKTYPLKDFIKQFCGSDDRIDTFVGTFIKMVRANLY